jgi:prephenate dehydrogenase
VHTTIIGLGLIGGSIGRRLQDQGWDVGFLDPKVSLNDARRAYAAARKVESLETIPADDLVILATPVDVAHRLLTKNELPNTITTVCSVMAPFADLARVSESELVAGHPFAGSESSGLDAAQIGLFSGKRWFLDRNTPNDRVQRMVETCGATVTWVDPEEHDRAVAFTSHLPQLLSTALAAAIANSGVDLELFAGSGLKTFLRLAASERNIWRPIFEANATAMEEGATDVIDTIETILTGSDAEAFQRANEVAKKLSS